MPDTLRGKALLFVMMALACNVGRALDSRLSDNSGGEDWPAYGRTYGEQHFSPLTEINDHSVQRLRLAWSMELGVGNPATAPVAVDGVLFFSSGLSVVHAVDAVTGKLLWRHDSETGPRAGRKLRAAWGNRGIAYWNGKVFTGTQDGRLIALDARSGRLLWSVLTVEPGDGRYITGAPRAFEGKIIIGHGGADTANTRGYVSTYDAESGRLLWRFYTVPGNPADGFEDAAQKMAAATWTGQWWKFGGGGTAWNAFTYDASTNTVLVGTGNGSPWNQKIRSPGGGDNLFLSSVLALDGTTGAYKWHYQVNPGETWDFNAAMDMALADLNIAGAPRKVLLTAPKNGFFYVLDRLTGKLISAEKITHVTWASGIDPTTGRPIEIAGARFPDGQDFEMWPGYTGAHSWMPMAYSPATRLVYIPRIQSGAIYNDRGIDLRAWQRPPSGADTSESVSAVTTPSAESSLLAWNPATQKEAWHVATVGGWNGGVLATGGNLVFHGQLNGRFSAYAADTGTEIWHFPAQAAILAAPIAYRAAGREYVTVLVGMGTSAGVDSRTLGGIAIDHRSQKKRVLSFVLDGTARLPAGPPVGPRRVPVDPLYRADAPQAERGEALYNENCFTCHGVAAQAGGTAPDLRASLLLLSPEAFTSVVREGALTVNGMPRFEDLTLDDVAAVRQYLRSRAATLRAIQ